MPTLSNGSKRNHCRAVQRAMRWAEEQGFIDRTPLAHFKKPRAGRREVVISPEEYEETFSLPSPMRVFGICWCSPGNGTARAAECVEIEKRHVDLAKGRIVFPPAEEKMGCAPRIIYLTDRATEIVHRPMLRTHNRLFVNVNGVAWMTDAVNCAFEQVQSRMGRKAMKEKQIVVCARGYRSVDSETPPGMDFQEPQSGQDASRTGGRSPPETEEPTGTAARAKYCLTNFRHSWCHHALCRGVDALTVSVLMGHADPSMVAKVYGHLRTLLSSLRTRRGKLWVDRWLSMASRPRLRLNLSLILGVAVVMNSLEMHSPMPSKLDMPQPRYRSPGRFVDPIASACEEILVQVFFANPNGATSCANAMAS